MNYKVRNYPLYLIISLVLITFLGAYEPTSKAFVLPLIFLVYGFFYRYAPVYAFLFALTGFFNFGQFLQVTSFGLHNSFNVLDIYLILCFVILIKPEFRVKNANIDKKLRLLIRVLLLFTIYQIIVTAYLKMSPSPFEFIRIFVHRRWTILGVFVAIPTYILIKNYSYEFLRTILLVCLTFSIIFSLSFFTGLELLKMSEVDRGFGVESQRYNFNNWGYLLFIIYFAFAFYQSNFNLYQKRITYITGIFVMLMVLVSLQRALTFEIITTLGFIFIISNRLFLNKVKFPVLVLQILIVLFLIQIIVPTVLPSMLKTYTLTYKELTGEIERGSTQTRSEIEMVNVLPVIKDNFVFGVGYQPYMFNAELKGDHGTTDFPILANLAVYGLVGMLIYLLMYVIVIKRIRSFLSSFRRNCAENLNSQTNYSKFRLILVIVFSAYMLNFIFLQHIYTSQDLSFLDGRVKIGFVIGILYGLMSSFEIESDKLKVQNN